MMLAAGTAISRLLGFVRSVLLAVTIGSVGSQAATAYGIAGSLPTNIYAMIGAGVLNAVLVPTIVRELDSRDGGRAFLSKILTLCVVSFGVVTVLLTLASPLLVMLYAVEGGRGMSPAAFELAIALGYWCVPQLFFYVIYAVLGEIYNARGQFGPYTWAPIVNNVVSIAGLLVFLVFYGGAAVNSDPAVWDTGRITAMGLITVGGVAAQASVLVFYWRTTGLKLRPDFRWRGVGLRSTGARAMWVFGIVLVGQIMAIIQTRVATLTDDVHGPSLLTFHNAWFVFQLPHSIVGLSIGIVYFTQMSNHATAGDLPALRKDVSTALRSIGMLTTFAMVGLMVISVPFARLYENGDFRSAVIMASLICADLIALVAFSATYVLERVYYALEDAKTPFMVNLALQPLQLATLVVAAFLPGEYVLLGICLGISLVNLATFAVWLAMVRKRIAWDDLGVVLRRHGAFLLFSLIAAVPGVLLVWLLGGYSATGWAHSGMLPAVVTCAIAGLTMLALYLGMLWVRKDPDLHGVIAAIRGRVAGGAEEAAAQ